jgi:hypothetical protein
MPGVFIVAAQMTTRLLAQILCSSTKISEKITAQSSLLYDNSSQRNSGGLLPIA